jgi:hypothetical protein
MPASAPAHAPGSTSKRTSVQNAARVAGAVFLLVGLLGFPTQLTFSGHHSDASLLGIANVSILHNLVHLAFGVAGVTLSRTFNSARAYLIAGGAAYLALFIDRVVVDHDSPANFLPVDNGDNWLHLGLSVAMIALGAALGRTRDDTGRPGAKEGAHANTLDAWPR